MSLLDNFAHQAVLVIAAFAKFTLQCLDLIDHFFRGLMHGAGLSIDVQTVLLLVIFSLFFVGVLRLLGGRIRFTLAFLLFLILAHTLAGVANGPLGGG